MSGEPYKTEHQISITADRIVKDLVKQNLPKGETFVPACWKAFHHLSPQEQLSAANHLRNSNLGVAVNPSAYFWKIIDRVKGTERKSAQTGRDVLGSVVHSSLMIECLDEKCLAYFGQLTEAQQLQAASEIERRLTPSIRNPSAFFVKIMAEVESGSKDTGSLAPARSAAQCPPVPATSKGRLAMKRLISDAIFLDDLSPECRRAYKRLPSEVQDRVKQMCAEILSVRTKSEACMLAIHSITGQNSPQPSPTEGMASIGEDVLLLPTEWADSVDENLYKNDTPLTQEQTWPEDALEIQFSRSSPSESQTLSPWEEHGTSATAHDEPDHSHTQLQAWPKDDLETHPMRSSPSESQTPSHWEERSTSATAHDEPDHPHTELQAWRPPPPPPPKRSSGSLCWRQSQALSQGGGQVASAAIAPEAAAAPPMHQENPQDGTGAIDHRIPPPPPPPKRSWPSGPQAPGQGGGQATSGAAAPEAAAVLPLQREDPGDGNGAMPSCCTRNSWANQEAAQAKLVSGRQVQSGREVLAKIVGKGLLGHRLDEVCVDYFGKLPEAQQLEVARVFKRRLNPKTRNPSAILSGLVGDVQSTSRSSGLQRPMQSAKRPAMPPFNPNRGLNAQRFSDTLFLYNLTPECRRAYERLPTEAQYRVKQLCAKFEAVRTYPEAFMNAIYDVTGQGRPQLQPDEGMDGRGEDELIPAKWSVSADEGQHEHNSPHSCLQAWPEDASEIQPMTSSPSESQTPSHWEERSTSATARDELDPPHTEPQAWPQDALDIQPKRSCLSESQTPSHWEERGTPATDHDETSHPHTELQACPEDAPEIQPDRSSPSESQTPSHWEERSTSATAHDDLDPPHTEQQAWPEDALEVKSKRSSPSDSQTPSHWEEQSTSATAHDEPDQPHTELQAWPEDALEIQPKRSSPSESQTPSHWEERSTPSAADDVPGHPHTELQAWPPDDPETQSMRNALPERQTPSQEEEYDTAAAAAPGGAVVPVKVEAIDTAAQELMGLLDI